MSKAKIKINAEELSKAVVDKWQTFDIESKKAILKAKVTEIYAVVRVKEDNSLEVGLMLHNRMNLETGCFPTHKVRVDVGGKPTGVVTEYKYSRSLFGL